MDKEIIMSEKVKIFNEQKEHLLVYHPEHHKLTFQNRKGMPSNRIYETREGRRALQGLQIIEERYHNSSWYQVITERSQNHLDKDALFYRGAHITYRQMIDQADLAAGALASLGIKKGDRIFCCLSNLPEVAYLMLGINKIGAKMNCIGAHFASWYIDEIIKECTHTVAFLTDDIFTVLYPHLKKASFQHIVVISKADSLPKNPQKCREYEPSLERFYKYPNLARKYAENYAAVSTYETFTSRGESNSKEVPSEGCLDDDFLITYTSGTTKAGVPKQVVHRNRSLIVMGIFHDPAFSGNPSVSNLRSLAHIHTEHNTDLITCYSDSFMQHWCVAPEPDYARKNFLDYLFLNKPNVVQATTNFCLEAAKEYLIDHRYHGRPLDFLLVLMAVGEACQPGEEYFINQFLKKAKAGSSVKLFGPLHFRYTTLGVGGGDTEHGGIYYSLWRQLFENLNKVKLNRRPYGLKIVPYVQAIVLKPDGKGGFTEANYNEDGILAANCSTMLRKYAEPEQLKEKIICDQDGNEWLSNDVLGSIDTLGCVHMKDRCGNKIDLKDGKYIYPYQLNEVIQQDRKNILTSIVCQTSHTEGGKIIINLEFSPLTTRDPLKILQNCEKRLLKAFPELKDLLMYRVFSMENAFPGGDSGKRDLVKVEELGAKRAFILDKHASRIFEG